MFGTDTTFLKVLVIVCLGAFLATSATVMDTWKHREATPGKLSIDTHQEALVTKAKLL